MGKSKQATKKIGGPRPAEGGPRADKTAAVADMKERLQASAAVLLTEYRGMTVRELAELREALRKTGTEYKVVKNTLATIAAREAGIEGLLPLLEGPTAIAWATGDPVEAAKQLADFAKKAPALVLKGALLEGRVLAGDEARRLATLESRDVMLARAVGMFLSPIQQMANVFAAGLNQLGAVLAQLRDKLEKEGPAPEPAEA